MEYPLKSIVLLIILLFLFTNCKSVETDTVSEETKIENKLDSIFTSLNQNGKFNGNVLVAKNDKVIYKKEFGFSDGKKQNALKATDRFNIGSIYKEIPAIAIMQLSEKKLLSLDDSIYKYLPNLPAWSKEVSIKNLLQYTSGLPRISWGKHKEINDEVLLNDISEIKELESNPGDHYLYTNNSPFLLSKIIENVSGEKFAEYVRKNILQPFQLNQSTFSDVFPYANRVSQAIPFDSNGIEDKMPFNVKSSVFLFSTTTEDLFKFLKKLHTYKMISQRSLSKIGPAADLKSDNMQSALGRVEFKNDKIIEHTHHGSSGNFECIISRNNLSKTTIILLTNTKNENVHAIKESIQEIVR